MPESQEDEDDYGPVTEVWNHLYSGLDMAEMELWALDDDSRRSVEQFGKAILKLRKSFVAPRHYEMVVSIFDELIDDAWNRHGAELEFAREAVDRATEALDRFADLRPVLSDHKLGERSRSYLEQAIDTFLFGFDAAAIAFCGATLEQVLKELAVSTDTYTEASLRKNQPTANTLLETLKREGHLASIYDPAKRLIDQRNLVMHKHLWQDKIIKGVAVQCIDDLAAVFVGLDHR